MEGGPGFDGMNPVVQTMGGIKGEEEEEIKGAREGCWFVVDVGLMMTGWRVVMMITENKERERAGKGYYLVCVCVVDLRGLRGWLVG